MSQKSSLETRLESLGLLPSEELKAVVTDLALSKVSDNQIMKAFREIAAAKKKAAEAPAAPSEPTPAAAPAV